MRTSVGTGVGLQLRNHLDCKQRSSHFPMDQALGSTTDPIRKTALLNHDREKKLSLTLQLFYKSQQFML